MPCSMRGIEPWPSNRRPSRSTGPRSRPSSSTGPSPRARGLGWIGKSGLLVTKEYGSAVRLASVLTDAELETGSPVDVFELRRLPPVRRPLPRPGDCRQELAARSLERADLQCGSLLQDGQGSFGTHQGIKGTICGVCINVCPWTQQYLARETEDPRHRHCPRHSRRPRRDQGDFFVNTRRVCRLTCAFRTSSRNWESARKVCTAERTDAAGPAAAVPSSGAWHCGRSVRVSAR